MVPHFRIPLNLPHAGTVSLRIEHHLGARTTDAAALGKARELVLLLLPYRLSEDNPAGEDGARVVESAARLGREVVAEIERLGAGHDRLGQAVRNLFECLQLGEEGAVISLRAGEDPKSALRPI